MAKKRKRNRNRGGKPGSGAATASQQSAAAANSKASKRARDVLLDQARKASSVHGDALSFKPLSARAADTANMAKVLGQLKGYKTFTKGAGEGVLGSVIDSLTSQRKLAFLSLGMPIGMSSAFGGATLAGARLTSSTITRVASLLGPVASLPTLLQSTVNKFPFGNRMLAGSRDFRNKIHSAFTDQGLPSRLSSLQRLAKKSDTVGEGVVRYMSGRRQMMETATRGKEPTYQSELVDLLESTNPEVRAEYVKQVSNASLAGFLGGEGITDVNVRAATSKYIDLKKQMSPWGGYLTRRTQGFEERTQRLVGGSVLKSGLEGYYNKLVASAYDRDANRQVIGNIFGKDALSLIESGDHVGLSGLIGGKQLSKNELKSLRQVVHYKAPGDLAGSGGMIKKFLDGVVSTLSPEGFSGSAFGAGEISTLTASMAPGQGAKILSKVTGAERKAFEAQNTVVRQRAMDWMGAQGYDARKFFSQHQDPTLNEIFSLYKYRKNLGTQMAGATDDVTRESIKAAYGITGQAMASGAYGALFGSLDLVAGAYMIGSAAKENNAMGVYDATMTSLLAGAIYASPYGRMVGGMVKGGARLGGNFGSFAARTVGSPLRLGHWMATSRVAKYIPVVNVYNYGAVKASHAIRATKFGTTALEFVGSRGGLLGTAGRGIGAAAGGLLGGAVYMLPGMALDIFNAASDYQYEKFRDKMENPVPQYQNSMYLAQSAGMLATERQRAAMFAKQSQMNFVAAMGQEATLFHM